MRWTRSRYARQHQATLLLALLGVSPGCGHPPPDNTVNFYLSKPVCDVRLCGPIHGTLRSTTGSWSSGELLLTPGGNAAVRVNDGEFAYHFAGNWTPCDSLSPPAAWTDTIHIDNRGTGAQTTVNVYLSCSGAPIQIVSTTLPPSARGRLVSP